MDIVGRFFLLIAAGLCLFSLVVLFLLGGVLVVLIAGAVVHGLLWLAERCNDGERAQLRKDAEDALWDAFNR